MFDKLLALLPDKKSRDLAMTVGGMAALLGGRKVVALSMFAKGLQGVEQSWREAHPEFNGGLADRWKAAVDFYEETHKDATNRKLHVIGIPMIVGGAAGLLLFPAYRPMWLASALSFGAGWALNILGHMRYEKNAPAFRDDPLSFIAGPIWDLKQFRVRRAEEKADAQAVAAKRSNGAVATA